MLPDLKFNIFNIIIICATIQGVILGLYILKKAKNKENAYLFLALLVLSISLNNLYYWLIDTKISSIWNPYYRLFYVPWEFLILPMYYYFVINYLKIVKKFSYWYLLPFLISIISHVILGLFYLYYNEIIKINIYHVKFFFRAEEYVVIFFTLYVVYRTFLMIREYASGTNHIELKIQTIWLKKLLYFGVFICLGWLSIIGFDNFYPNVLPDVGKYYFVWITLSILIYWLAYSGIHYMGVFNQRLIIRKANKSSHNSEAIIKPSDLQKFEEIDKYIKINKIFTDPNLSLKSVSSLLNISELLLSQMIKNYKGLNFSNYINELRIVESKVFLKDDNYKHFTIIAIGLESGFNSKSAFYHSFKKFTGISPSIYRKNNY